MVDYEFNRGSVSKFKCVLADWGTVQNHGGTPMYAGPRTYENEYKDFFSFGRLALELLIEPKGKWTISKVLKIAKSRTCC